MKARIPATVDYRVNSAGDTRKPAPRGIQVERFTPEHVQNPMILAAALNRLHQAHAAASLNARADESSKVMRFLGLAVGSAGAKLRIRHNLGKRVQWRPIGWYGKGVVNGHSLVSDEADAAPETDINTLVLRSYVAGTVDLEVF